MMRKRNPLLVLALFLAASASIFGQQKIYLICWEDTGLPDPCLFDVSIANPVNKANFESKPLLEFNVPKSATRTAIFFEWNGSLVFSWSGNEPRFAVGNIGYYLISSLIPKGYVVRGGFNIFHENSNNPGEVGMTGTSRWARYCKHVLRMDNPDLWNVYEVATGNPLPPADTIKLLNAMINDGFIVQAYAYGIVQGVSVMTYIQVNVQVTGID